ncbi:hypothetical protein FSP39_019700 [Pinctada imbricata]|uniref:Ras-related protein Rab n=1 Tax=Pinctada imbricata TaxID=66713 RepID=A0AA88XXJ3_PINIB|nr:hypothetical protein FSP39_019700 [Pinctada imbricata]
MAEGSAEKVSKQEHLYKVLVIGEFGVGKTSIIRRYTEGSFSPNYKLTIGVDFALKTLEWDETTKVNLQLWDIAGHERFGHMTRVYYKYAPATFDTVAKWLSDINSKVMLADQSPVPVMLLANKCDLEESYVDSLRLEKYCQEHGLIGWFPTSAKNDSNIDNAMKCLVKTFIISDNAMKCLVKPFILSDNAMKCLVKPFILSDNAMKCLVKPFILSDNAMKCLVKKILELPSESQQASEHISLSTSLSKAKSQKDDSFEMTQEVTTKKASCCS